MPHILLALTWANVLAILGGMAAGAAIVNPLVTYARRPRLTLAADSDLTWTRVESDGCVYVRGLVECSRWTRGAKGARVMVECYRPKGTAVSAGTTLGGTPSLGWPSAQDGTDGSLTVHPGATRAIDIGALTRGSTRHPILVSSGDPLPESDPWHLHLSFAGGFAITDGRDVLPPGEWTIRLLFVADDASAKRYDVGVTWDGDAYDASDVLDTLAVSVEDA